MQIWCMTTNANLRISYEINTNENFRTNFLIYFRAIYSLCFSGKVFIFLFKGAKSQEKNKTTCFPYSLIIISLIFFIEILSRSTKNKNYFPLKRNNCIVLIESLIFLVRKKLCKSFVFFSYGAICCICRHQQIFDFFAGEPDELDLFHV
jgi:hypothetical protein